MGQGDASEPHDDTTEPGTETAEPVATTTDERAGSPADTTATPSNDAWSDDGDDDSGWTYRGLLGTFPYAIRATDSLFCRVYVVVGTVLTLFVAILFLVGVVSAFVNTLGSVGGSFTFSRSFVFLLGTVVALPLIAPVVLVARRHRLGRGSLAYDRAMAATGFLYAASLYLALVISAPPDRREAPPAALAPIVETLYDLPQVAGLVPPLAAAVLLIAVHRRYRGTGTEP